MESAANQCIAKAQESGQRAARLVEEYLRLLMIPAPDRASAFVAPDLLIRFTGGREMGSPQECAAFNATRYAWVKKKFEGTEVVAGASDEETVVYMTGTLYGEWTDGTPFSGNRCVDRYVVRHGRITSMDVWNDSAEYSWREYGNRVGAWRCLELFDSLALPTGALINTALYDHCPELVAAVVARGDKLIGHGVSNSVRQSELSADAESALLGHCRERIAAESGTPPDGWLSPWISESRATPDLLAAAGYRYTLNWCHDDQPTRMATSHGPLWSIPYPQEVNDIPMIINRQMNGKDFAQMIVDQFDEMLEQARRQPLVMGIALRPYIVGQPYRLRHLLLALEHIAAARDRNAAGRRLPARRRPGHGLTPPLPLNLRERFPCPPLTPSTTASAPSSRTAISGFRRPATAT